jgi:predicted component of type VI protein secretion system
MSTMNRRWLVLTTAACVCFTACSTKSGDNEPWSELNSRLVQKHNIKVRTRDVPNNQYPVRVTKQ